MKKMTYFVMALAFVLGFTQCKKEQLNDQNDNGNLVPITLTVEGGTRAVVNPGYTNTETGETYATVAFENDDVIYVGYKVGDKNALVGTLIYNEGTFSGSVNISEIVANEYLHFYFLGGKGFNATVNETDNTATVNISDQSSKYPVISYAPSKQPFTGAGSYSAKLQNKVSIMKFNVTTPSSAAICITGMNNKVTLNFNPNTENTDQGFSYSVDTEDGGLIEMPAKGANNETWAIVLPQEELTTTGDAYSEDHSYTGTRPTIHAIEANKYYHEGDDVINMEVSTPATPPFDPSTTALTFEAKMASASVTLQSNGSAPDLTLEYSTDGGTNWYGYTVGTTIPLTNIGDKVMFHGTNGTIASSASNYHHFVLEGDVYVYGNVMSLLDASGFGTATTISASYAFRSLFDGCSGLYNLTDKPIVLPATTITSYCYQRMFYGCSNLTAAPELPATTVSASSYIAMFQNCTSLTTAPELPATTIATSCYSQMFSGCTSLITGPTILPAETLSMVCYGQMFYGCTSLTTAPMLPAKTLVMQCYNQMFDGCTNLNSITCLATSGMGSTTIFQWVRNVAASGTFYKASNASWSSGVSGIPNNWTIKTYSSK